MAAAFDELLRACRRSAVHLEARDGYSKKDPAFVAWLANRGGAVDPLAWYAGWAALVAEVVGQGVSVRRARIVSEPVSDYVRFEHDITGALNLAAGEDVRWLPRREASDIALPGNDFWLFDGATVLINHFSGAGESVDHELSTSADLVALCSTAFESVWARATPHEEYRPA